MIVNLFGKINCISLGLLFPPFLPWTSHAISQFAMEEEAFVKTPMALPASFIRGKVVELFSELFIPTKGLDALIWSICF